MREVLYKKGLFFAVIALFVGTSIVPSISSDELVFGNTVYVDEYDIYVDDDSECPGNGTQKWPYCKIQYAIDNASSRDSIFVYSGTYYENVVVDKRVELIGEHMATTIVNGGGGESGVYGVITILHDWVTVSRFRVTNGGGGWCNAGVYVSSDNNIITNMLCDDTFNGIWLMHSNNNEILNNTVQNNDYYGISLYYASKNIISGNTIQYRHHTGLGISGERNQIYRNYFSNPYYTGVAVVNNSNSIYENNFIDCKKYVYNRMNNLDDITVFDGNYWGRPRLLPYLIFSWLEIESDIIPNIPWFTFDLHPAKEPYDIP